MSQRLKLEATSADRRGLFIRNGCGNRGVGGAFAHHDAVSDRVVRGLVCSDVDPSLPMVHHGLKIGRLRSCSSPVTLPFADEALGWLPASLASMSLMSQKWSILVAAILLLMKKGLVQILEAPLVRFTCISRERFEEGLEVPSTSRAIVGLKTLGLLVVGPQHCLEAGNCVSIRQNGPRRFGGSGSNTPRCNFNRKS